MELKNKIKALQEEWAQRPDPAHTYVGLVIGHRFVELAIAEKRPESDEEPDESVNAAGVSPSSDRGIPRHPYFGEGFPGFSGERPLDEDAKGDFRMLRHARVEIVVDRGVTPGVQVIKQAFQECWAEVNAAGPISYQEFYVCLPAWACRGATVSEELDIGEEGYSLFDAHPRIRSEHVRVLENRVAENVQEAGYDLVDLCTHFFRLDTGRQVLPPEREVSTSLELNGYVTLAYGALLRELMGILKFKRIDVSGIVTPAGACGGLLYKDQRQCGAVVVEVSERNTGCGYYWMDTFSGNRCFVR